MKESEENDNKCCQKNFENSSLNNGKSVNLDSVFHAIFIPTDVENSENISQDLHVYTDTIEALKAMKKYKSGRLQKFKTRHEALEYAKHGTGETNINNKNNPVVVINNSEEKSSNFKGPKSQELVAFRKLIENGKLDEVKDTVWNNPRYLISGGDTPAILQEGCRYNAAHIASFKSSNHAEMLKLILNTVSDPKFVGFMYGKEEDAERAQILLDLYLNTPDKALNETPLHFAAKFGIKDVVRLLVSYPQCQKNTRNKWGQTPKEIVCARKGLEDKELAQEICGLLEDQYYVPVLRAEDNILQPVIGEPFSPMSPPRINVDPLSPKVEVAAFAGPMSKPQAVEFRKKWKTPPRKVLTPSKRENMNDSFNSVTSPKSRNPSMRLQDAEKGLERVGRDLAEEYHVCWKEYWPFLNNFADLRCTEGLSMLESYFSSKVLSQQCLDTKTGSESNEDFSFLDFQPLEDFSENLEKIGDTEGKTVDESLDEIEGLTRRLEMCSLKKSSSENSDSDDEFLTPPASPGPMECDGKSESSDEDLVEAEEGDVFFIDGAKPGKTDIAVINAIPEFLDAEIYPSIYRWKHEVKLAMSRNMFCFVTPRKRLLLTPERTIPIQAGKLVLQ